MFYVKTNAAHNLSCLLFLFLNKKEKIKKKEGAFCALREKGEKIENKFRQITRKTKPGISE